MNSLRLRLIVGAALGMAAVLIASAWVLHALLGRALRAEFDAALASSARSLTALVEYTEDGVEFELATASMPVLSHGDDLFHISDAHGRVIAQSPVFEGVAFARFDAGFDEPVFHDMPLPDGRPGRGVWLAFRPRVEDALSPPQESVRALLVVVRSTSGLLATLAHVRTILLAVCALAVLISSLLMAWIVDRGLRPLGRISEQIAAVGAERMSDRLEAHGAPRELAPIVLRLNELLGRLEAAFERERRFTGDVAHELRTPLGGLRAKLELALSREREPEAYRNSLGDSLEITVHMQRMVETLLHLARADAGQLEVRRTSVDLASLLRDCWEHAATLALKRGLQVEWTTPAEHVIETDPELLRLVAANLFDNAARYADPGRVAVSVQSDADGSTILSISNAAPNLPADLVPRMFDRFWRGPAAGSIADGHCGLGLALCRAIVERLGGSIRTTLDAEQRLTITIRFAG